MSAWSGTDAAPSKEYLLRQEYPDLEEKWIIYLNLKSIFVDVNKELNKFGMVERFFNSEEYNSVRNRWIKIKSLQENALKEYQMLEKLLWDY